MSSTAELEKCVEDACSYIPKIKDAMSRLDALHTVLSLKHDKCKQQVSGTIGRLQKHLTDIHTSMDEEIEKEMACKKKYLDSKKEILACRIRSTASLCLDIEQVLKLTDSEEHDRRAASILSSWKDLMSFDPEPSDPQYFEFVPAFRKVSEVLTPSSIGFIRTLLGNPLDVELKITAENEIHILCYRGETSCMADCLQVILKGREDVHLPIVPLLNESNSLKVDSSGVPAGSYRVHCLLYGVDVLSSPATVQIPEKQGKMHDTVKRPPNDAILEEVEERVLNLPAKRVSEAKKFNPSDPWASDCNNNTLLTQMDVGLDEMKDEKNSAKDGFCSSDVSSNGAGDHKFSFSDAKKFSSILEPCMEKPWGKTTYDVGASKGFAVPTISKKFTKSTENSEVQKSSLADDFASLKMKDPPNTFKSRTFREGFGCPSSSEMPKKALSPRKSVEFTQKLPEFSSQLFERSGASLNPTAHSRKLPSPPQSAEKSSFAKTFGGFGVPSNPGKPFSDKSDGKIVKKETQGLDKEHMFGAWKNKKDDVIADTATTKDLLRAANLLVECGKQGGGAGPTLKFPIGITRSQGNQDVIVCDSGNHMVKVFNWKGKYQFCIGSKGMMAFKRPSAVVTNALGEIFVKDDLEIAMFKNDGEFIRTIGTGVLQRPYGLALTDAGHLLVIDHGHKMGSASVVLFEQNGRLVKQSTFEPVTKVSYTKCRFIAVWKDSLYVVDLGKSIVYVTDFYGKEKRRFGQFGKEDGDFREPSGISIDPEGHVYIADSKNDRIQIFNSEGVFLSRVSLNHRLQRPSDIHVTPDKYLLVSNYLKHNVQVYQLTPHQADGKVSS